MNKYYEFLNFETVVNIANESELKKFVEFCKKRGLLGTTQIEKYSFEELHQSGGIQVISYGELCVEHVPDKGLTIGARRGYERYGCDIITLAELIDNEV